jgi:biotin carboxyl carrier protein
MNEYRVTVDGREFAVAIAKDGSMCIDGKVVPVDIGQINTGTFSVLLDGVSTTLVVRREGGSFHVLMNSLQKEISVQSERELLLKTYGGTSGSQRSRLEVFAPMPALIVKVEVNVGDEVVHGQGLLVLEAMKMENELKAVHSGRVKEIRVRQGKPVEKGELLMILE